VPEFVTFTPSGAAEPTLAFTDLTALGGLPDDVDPDAHFDRVEEVRLRDDATRQVLVTRMYGGNSGAMDWCVIGAVGDGIGCWSQLDLDARAKPQLRPDEEIGLDDWLLEVAGNCLRLGLPIFDPDDAHCCPSRGSFAAELSAHPVEPRLVVDSFVRQPGQM